LTVEARLSWEMVKVGLDQLFFNPFCRDETPQDRADAIDQFLTVNGWTWDEVLEGIANE